MVTEPIRAICRGPPVHTDHQVAVQENLGGGGRGRAGREHGIMSPTPIPGQGGCGGDTGHGVQLELDVSFPERVQSTLPFRNHAREVSDLP